jgi:hypothetical protein
VVTSSNWPSALRRFFNDCLPERLAPADDGISPPASVIPEWLAEVAPTEIAVEVVSAERQDAESDAKTAEDKAARLAQTVLAMLTIAIAVTAYELNFVVSRGWVWAAAVMPSAVAVTCLALAAFEAIQIDGAGAYRRPRLHDLAGIADAESRKTLLAVHERGRALARWSANNKTSDLMQARAWLSRGVAALVIAGLTAAVSASIHKPDPSGAAPHAAASTVYSDAR